MICVECGVEFESKRSTARYCSAKCRVTANRVSVTESLSVTGIDVTDKVSVALPGQMPVNFGRPDCECRMCRNNRYSGSRFVINHGGYKAELAVNELNRVSLPGDIDY